MSALEIKPGKYRTRGGEVAAVRSDAFYTNGFVGNVGGKHCSWHTDGRASMYSETGADLIERIEDEPKYGAPVAWPFPVKAPSFPTTDYHVSYGAQDAIRANDRGQYEHQLSTAVKWCAARNLKLVAMHEWDGPPICSDREAMLNGKIARLEAENESLSRQLRSRELNKEPATDGKVWRWSPMV